MKENQEPLEEEVTAPSNEVTESVEVNETAPVEAQKETTPEAETSVENVEPTAEKEETPVVVEKAAEVEEVKEVIEEAPSKNNVEAPVALVEEEFDWDEIGRAHV